MMDIHLYIGPTLTMVNTTELPKHFVRHAPVKQGDIQRLLESNSKPAVIIIVDGYFEHELSVSHSELCLALDSGWQVYGLSDMGAIRAFELRQQGMHGYGQVYRSLMNCVDLPDDEILWACNVGKPYSVDNEPLIHLHAALRSVVKAGYLDTTAGRDVLATLKQQWYKKRTLRFFINLLREHSPSMSESEINHLKENFNRFRIKCQDFDRFMFEQPWCQ